MTPYLNTPVCHSLTKVRKAKHEQKNFDNRKKVKYENIFKLIIHLQFITR